MSTYSPSLRVELITQGDQAGQWGTTTNNNFSDIFDVAIAGYQTVSVISANQALTYNNGPVSTAALNQSVYAMLRLTTTTAAAFSVYAPPNSKQYIIWNNSGYAATIYNSTVIGNTTAAGTGVTIANGDRLVVFSDGTNFYEVKSTNVTGTVAIANGGTGQTTANAAFNALAPSQSGQNGRYLKSDGTNASWDTLDISTGDITGVLPVANGGTGQSTQQTAINALAGAVTSGSYLRGNGTNVVMSTIQAADLPTATDSANGAIKLGSGTAQTVAANSVTATASRTYALQVNAGGQGVVNVPWTATSPGGSTTQVQYNNAGVFAGSSNFVFDGTNVGIGASTPSTYGKFVVGGAGSFTSSLVSTSATLTDKPTFEFRKTENTPSIGITNNQIGRISFYSQQGSTTTESAYINARDYRVGNISLPELKLATYTSTVGTETNFIILGTSGMALQANGTSGFTFTGDKYVFGAGADKFYVDPDAEFAGAVDVGGALAVGGAITSNSVPVVTTTGSQTLTNKTLGSGLVMSASTITSGTFQSTTSGTSKDFTGIPSWVKRITVLFGGVGTNGNSYIQIQIGAGSITTSGYGGGFAGMTGSGPVYSTSVTTGIAALFTSSVSTWRGAIQICNFSGNSWVASGTLFDNGNNYSVNTSGSITLGGVLDRLRLTTVNGTDVFDAGSVNILYE